MAITIEGIKVGSLSISRDDKTGELKVSGHYELLTPTGRVLAKQGFNGYNDITLGHSPATMKALQELYSSVVADLNATLGMG